MRFLLTSLFLLLSVPWLVFAAHTNGEQINSFVSNIYLNADGTFLVHEDIQYNFGDASKHGVFRTINKRSPQDSGSFWKKRTLDITNINVTIDSGNEVPFTLTDSPSTLEIKIGDSNKTITGVHTYTISYVVKGGYSYFSDGTAEIYWNVTGNEWQVPIDSAEAIIHAGTARFAQNQACYAGELGTQAHCSSLKYTDAETAQFSSQNLLAGYGLTVAQSIDGGSIARVIVEGWDVVHLLLVAIPLFALLLGFSVYRYKTKYKMSGPVIAQYEPYKGFKPMYTGVLFDGKLDPRDITAGIIYLAQKGYIKITKINRKVLFLIEVDDYQVTLLKSSKDIESPFLKEVLSLLFPDTELISLVITLSDLKETTAAQKVNYEKVQALRTSIKKDMKLNGFFENKPPFFLSRRTTVGYEALNYLKGFKLFLSVTDKERFKFHNAPQKSPELFMEYLPYAIAFGVEKQWAKVFDGITIPNPDWYNGGSNVAAFSAMNLTSSISAFSNSLTASTSSSSTSGSGGSGFSGGGGGGGGGGSW